MTSPSSEPRCLAAALEYARHGLRVLIIHGIDTAGKCTCRRADCQQAGKHPRTRNGSKDATADEAQLKQWLEMWPDSNIGIATGPESGFFTLDVDPRHGGDETLRQLESKNGVLPVTPETITGGGGWHVHLRYPADQAIRNSASLLGPGLDIRGEGGYVIAAPSVHVSGREYAIEVEHDYREIPFAEAPKWLLTRLLQGERPRSACASVDAEFIPEGKRNTTLASFAGSMRHKGMAYEAIKAALLAVNAAQCSPPLPSQEVEGIAASYARYAPGVLGAEGAHPHEQLSQVFGKTVIGVYKRGARDASYEVQADDGTIIVIGSASNLLSFRKVQAAVLDATKHVMQPCSKSDWMRLVEVIAACAELVDTATPEEETAHFLFQYIETGWHGQKNDLIKNYREMRRGALGVLRLEDRVYVRMPAFVSYLTQVKNMRISFREVGHRLSRLGFEKTRLQARDGDNTISVRVWAGPPGWHSRFGEEA